jgi:hypothetical protein
MSKVGRLKQQKKKRRDRSQGHSGAPNKKPYLGAQIVFMYGNPMAIGSPTVPMAAVITSFGSTDGRIVNGRAFTDPGVSGTTPAGEPIQVPPLIPMIEARYSTSGAKLTWHWRGDVNLRSLNLLRGDTAEETPAEGEEAADTNTDAVPEPPDEDEAEGAKVVSLK